MDPMVAVIALALSWHFGLVLLQRFRSRIPSRPSLAKLLSFAELDLLRTLRDELKRLLGLSPEPRHEQKLREVERRLEEMGDEIAEGANV